LAINPSAAYDWPLDCAKNWRDGETVTEQKRKIAKRIATNTTTCALKTLGPNRSPMRFD
jgi:hypothetical protein